MSLACFFAHRFPQSWAEFGTLLSIYFPGLALFWTHMTGREDVCAVKFRRAFTSLALCLGQVCKEAEIEEIAMDSREQAQSVYITKGSEGPIVSDKKKEATMAAAH